MLIKAVEATRTALAHPLSSTSVWRRAYPFCTALLLLIGAVFVALRFIHLTADFPNHSPWMDWAKYTDEGWYGDAAIRHYQLGHWYVQGDFNPAAALPVWPLIELAVFHFTGVTVTAARALTVTIFTLILAAAFLLLRPWLKSGNTPVAAVAVLLLAVSPFCFVFTRMAILEPLLVLFMLLALLGASATSRKRAIFALGFLLPLMILTKTTAVFLFPAVFFLLFASNGYRLRPFCRVALPACALAAALWIGYFALFVRPHFLADYRYLFSANAYTGISVATAPLVLTNTIKDGMWMGRFLYPLSLAGSAATLLLLRRRIPPLIAALLLWAAGYAAFLAYHNNLQPRYYLVVAVPMTLLLPLTLRELTALLPHTARLTGIAVATALLFVVAVPDGLETLRYVRTPEYTFAAAADNVKRIVTAHPGHNPLVLSISGSDISLMTGLPSICDDFGTMELAQRVETYRPGWYAAWNQVDDDKMEALAPLYRLVRVAAFPAYDDPERNLLILYRLDPHAPTPHGVRRHKPVVPHLLETRMGQQPTAMQLEH